MTFEEAKEKIGELFVDPPAPPGYSVGDFDPEFTGYIEDLEEIVENLAETYSSDENIKVSKNTCDELVEIAYDNYDDAIKAKVFAEKALEICKVNLESAASMIRNMEALREGRWQDDDGTTD